MVKKLKDMVHTQKQKIRTVILDYVIMLIGLSIYALSWILFLVPAQITGGGISGLSAVIFYSTKIPIGLTFFLINVVLVGIAMKILGASFGIKTIFSMSRNVLMIM